MASNFAQPRETHKATPSIKRSVSRILHVCKDTGVRFGNYALDTKRSRLNAATAVSEPTADERVCKQCLDLNFPALIKEFKKAYDSERIYPTPWVYVKDMKRAVTPVGIGYMSSQDSTCVICQVLTTSRLKHEVDSQDKPNPDGSEGDELWAISYNFLFPMWSLIEKVSEGRNIYLILVPHDFTWDPHEYRKELTLKEHIKVQGCVALTLESTNPAIYSPQPIRRSFSPSVVKPWLQYCLKNHRRLCNSKTIPIRGMQVIDCMTHFIKDYKANTPYVTLSYVWGSSGNACGSIRIVEGHKTLPGDLSAVITDSIEVTKALGYRYLWVDKFCIDQNDPDLKHEQIREMDRIYQNSELTIIGAAGRDETYGLPGVGVRERSQQLVAKLDGATVLWTPKDPHGAILSSHWSTRGWTFQEAVLSRRRLVFTDDQVYFQCNTMECFESVSCPLDKLHRSDKSKIRKGVRIGLFGRNKGEIVKPRHAKSLNNALRRYLSNVEDYAGRDLRFDEDSLNAFRGIIRHFSKQKHSFFNSWGLVYSAEHDSRAHCFAHSLAWRHVDTRRGIRRRPLFPSWTWAGWQGKIRYSLWDGGDNLFRCGLREIILESPVHDNVRLEDVSHENMDAVGEYRLLRVTALTVPIAQISYWPESNASSPWVIGRGIERWEAQLFLSVGSQNNAELYESFQNLARWQFIYIGELRKVGFVMVLQSLPGSDMWQRSGIFKIARRGGSCIKVVGASLSTFLIG